jgi:cytochrome b561
MLANYLSLSVTAQSPLDPRRILDGLWTIGGWVIEAVFIIGFVIVSIALLRIVVTGSAKVRKEHEKEDSHTADVVKTGGGSLLAILVLVVLVGIAYIMILPGEPKTVGAIRAVWELFRSTLGI